MLHQIYFNKIKIFLALIIIIVFFLSPKNYCAAQTNCQQIPVNAYFQFKKLILNDTVYQLKNAHRIKFESFKFYLSNVVLLKANETVWQEENSFHLIDFEENDSNNLCLNLPEDLIFDAIQFNLGIDSLTNVSGALGGDLDPTKGMYWTWQSGYINFKLEGTSDLCNNAKNQFEYHLGGYIPPFRNVQQIKLTLSNPNQFGIIFNLDQFINWLDLALVNHIMSPNKFAVEHAQQAAKCFSIIE